MDWITGVQNAINYIEDHITEDLNYEAIAKESCASSFHFQRVFNALCGYTVGEYIRNRRMSLAGTDFATGKDRVIDVAAKYGYDSPESFTKAFQKFHGITPSQARGNGAMLKSFSRLSIKVSLEGGNTMNYRIEEKPAIILTGYKARFTGNPSDKRLQDHEFACKNRLYQYILEGMNRDHVNSYQVLTNFGPDGYDFYFAHLLPKWALDDFDKDLGETAKNFEHLHIPEGQYMVCETDRCTFPTSQINELRRRAVTEWLPSSGYELRNAPEVVAIHWYWEDGNEKLNTSRYCELWLPIVKKV